MGWPRASTTRPIELRPDRDLHHRAGGLDGVALLDLGVVTQDDGADRLLFEVQRHALDAAGELQQLGRERAVDAVDAGDAVADLHHSADRTRLHARIELVDGGLDDLGDVVGADCHAISFRAVASDRDVREVVLESIEATADGTVDEAVAEADLETTEEPRIDRAD